jgi:TonB family protein
VNNIAVQKDALNEFPVTREYLQKFKPYPETAKERHAEADAIVQITVDRKGRVLNSNISVSSRFSDLDRQASAMFMRAQPRPSIADDIADKAETYSLLVNSVKATRLERGSGSLPTRIGQCVETSILAITDRFGQQLLRSPSKDRFESGTAIEYANGGFQISYHNEAAVIRSAIGDKVKMCLVKIPADCARGDDRGRVYNTKNLRTSESWTLADAQHSCGGA